MTAVAQLPRVVRLDGQTEVGADLLGNKGFQVNSMRRRGLPVPPAFALTTQVCRLRQDDAEAVDAVWDDVVAQVGWLEEQTGRTFGRGPRPLLVSVRSGAAASMPGMMDTVLDLGIDDAVEQALAALSGAEFAADVRHRFSEMYTRIVLSGAGDVPSDPWRQLRGAIEAVFASWQSPRARAYREYQGIDGGAGTAVVVQAMVFGNLPERSGTGVLFTRDPMTGAPEPYGEWLSGGQGEDVVSGTHDCEPLSALGVALPEVLRELLDAATLLEQLAADVQDIEFTVEDGRLWLLQTRRAKRSPQAAVRLAVAFVEEGAIDRRQALDRLTPHQVEQLLQPSLQPEDRLAAPLLARGLPACPGVASGRAVDDPDEAVDAADAGEDVVLVRAVTSPDDVHGMIAGVAVVTEMGGATSHAAVVSREIGRPAVVGCGSGAVERLRGKQITVDGATGEVREGVLPLTAWSEADSADLRALAEWARACSPLQVWFPGEAPAPDAPSLQPSEASVQEAVAQGTTAAVSARPLVAMLHALAAGPNQAEHTATESEGGSTMGPLVLLQTLRLKGRADAAAVAEATGVSPEEATSALSAAVEAGQVAPAGRAHKLTEQGLAELAGLLADERAGVDAGALHVTYDRFCEVNGDFKALITDWQLRDGEPNDHTDQAYDDAVFDRLGALHERALPVLEDVAQALPRLAAYPVRLARALERVRGGEAAYVSRPIADSYHTVWFELHEELIGAAGLTREDEAAAGRAV